jgi:hypothetical protein
MLVAGAFMLQVNFVTVRTHLFFFELQELISKCIVLTTCDTQHL